jgi:hypothetical protein
MAVPAFSDAVDSVPGATDTPDARGLDAEGSVSTAGAAAVEGVDVDPPAAVLVVGSCSAARSLSCWI